MHGGVLRERDLDLTNDQVKEAIADGKIAAITLDTSILDQNGNRFEQGLLARLKQFNGTQVGVVLSDVVVREVMAHVVKAATEAQAKIVSAIKEVGKAWHINQKQRDDAMAILFGKESPEQLTDRRIDGFIKSAQIEIIESAGRVDVGAVLDSYFRVRPPFETVSAKKNEFPDAIALQALERWAKDKDVLLLAVSEDKGWKEYGKTSSHLVVSDNLANALSYFHQNAEVACARLVARFNEGQLQDIEEKISAAVQNAVYGATVIPDASSGYRYDADVDEINVENVTISDDTKPFTVIDKPEEDVLVVETEVEVTLEVSSSFKFMITDPIDKDDVPIGSASATAKVYVEVKALLTFDGDLAGDAELVDVEVDMDGDRINVDYGEVGPEWGDDEDDSDRDEG